MQRRPLETELEIERAATTRILKERDEAIRAAQIELTRLTAELMTERAISARLQQEHDEELKKQPSARQHVVLSSYLGDYTSEFLDAKTTSQRAALLASIYSTTKMIWDSGAGLSWEVTTQMIRMVMAQHGFVFREPGEGQTGWDGYATKVPDVGAVEQLDKVVRTHRDELGATGWYLNELTAVLLRVGQYLERKL